MEGKNNAVHLKRELDGFWRPTNQIFVFWPFIFLLKKDEYRSAWRLEPPTAHILTVFQAHCASRLSYFKKSWWNFVL